MSIATNTTEGDIILAGDLAGFGESPQLRATGVTAGAYGVPNLVIDSKGRIIFAKTNDDAINQLLNVIPLASATTKGKFSIGNGFIINDITLNLPSATTTTAGVFAVGSGLTLTNNTVDVIIPKATTNTFGIVKVDNIGLRVNNSGFLYNPTVLNATTDSFGISTSNNSSALVIDANSIISVPNATTSTAGVVTIDNTTLDVNSSGLLSVKRANNSYYGYVDGQYLGYGFNITSNTINFTGRLMSDLPLATASVLGKIKINTVTNASISTSGSLTISADGTLSCNAYLPASSVIWGVVRPDSAYFTVIGGEITSTTIASNTNFGIVKIGSGFSLVNNEPGHIKVDRATSTTKGIIRVGNYNSTTGYIARGFNINSGDLSLAVPYTNAINRYDYYGQDFTAGILNFSRTHLIQPVTLTADTIVNINGALSNNFILKLNGSSSINFPTNIIPGTIYNLTIFKTNTSDTFTLHSGFKLNKTLNNTFTLNQVLSLVLIVLDQNTIITMQRDVLSAI